MDLESEAHEVQVLSLLGKHFVTGFFHKVKPLMPILALL